MTEELGDTAEKYRALVQLGQGGTANVYLGVAHGPVGFNKLVVLKALKKSLATDDEFRRMFLNEARLSARLNHPNIVQVNEVIEQDGLPVLVMEYLQGQALSDIRTRMGASLDREMHLRILSEALAGLHYSHELKDYDGTPLGVVHRDMTPHNVFVTYEGQVKVLDFGIAKLEKSLVETMTGVIKGKLRYMPPEQIAGERVDRRADVFAVGVMLWEAATGQRMWQDVSEANVMNRVLRGEIPQPKSVYPDIPAELERIVSKALAYDREDRHTTAAELQKDLDTYLQVAGNNIRARHIGARVGSVFEDARTVSRRVIEKKLSSLVLAQTDAGTGLTVQGGHAPLTLSTHANDDGTSVNTSSPIDTTKSRLMRSLLVALGLGLGLLVATFGWYFGSAVSTNAVRFEANGQDQASVVLPVEPSELNSGTKPAESLDSRVHEVDVHVTVFPSSATLSLDGTNVEGNPHRRLVAADGSTHTLEANAAGYERKTVSITYDRDREVVLTLEKTPLAPAPTPKNSEPERPKRPVVTPPPATEPASASQDSCDPPYYVTGRGIKKYKAACL